MSMRLQACPPLLMLACLLLALGGCARGGHYTPDVANQGDDTVPAYHDQYGRAYYHDISGRTYYKDPRGERHYVEAGRPWQQSQGYREYRVEEGTIRSFRDESGRRYILDESGGRHYMEPPVSSIYVDDAGNRFYVDESGTRHFITPRVARRFVSHPGQDYGRYFVDQAGQRYYFVDRGLDYVIDERGTGYYVVRTDPQVLTSPIQIIRLPQASMTPQEAAMMNCDKQWNDCFLRCNELASKTSKDRCLKRCDKDFDRCMGGR